MYDEGMDRLAEIVERTRNSAMPMHCLRCGYRLLMGPGRFSVPDCPRCGKDSAVSMQSESWVSPGVAVAYEVERESPDGWTPVEDSVVQRIKDTPL